MRKVLIQPQADGRKLYACLTVAKKQTGRTEVLMMSPSRTQPHNPLPLTMPHLLQIPLRIFMHTLVSYLEYFI